MIINKEFPITFSSQIDDEPCDILVTWYLPYIPAHLHGPMEEAVEDIPPEFEFSVFKKGTKERFFVTPSSKDRDRIFDEFEAYLLASKHDKDF